MGDRFGPLADALALHVGPVGRLQVLEPGSRGLPEQQSMTPADVVVGNGYVGFSSPADDGPVDSDLVRSLANEPGPRLEWTLDHGVVDLHLTWGDLGIDFDLHDGRPFEPEALLDREIGEHSLHLLLEDGEVQIPFSRSDPDRVPVGGRWSGVVAKAGEIGLTSEPSGELGGMESTPKNAPGRVLEEPFQSSFQAFGEIHQREVTAARA